MAIKKVKKVVKKTKPAAEKKATPVITATGTYEGYCVKCKEKGVKFEGVVSRSENGTYIAKGPHTECGTTVCRIIGKNPPA